MKDVPIKKSVCGECPQCKSWGNFQYDKLVTRYDDCYYPCTCDKCGWKGKEWYVFKFVEYTEEKNA